MKLSKVILFSAVGFGISTIAVWWMILSESFTFLETSSPERKYTVKLKGQKERPIFFTASVYFNAEKENRPFLVNKYLHSGDAFDVSFELGFPNHQWLSENVLHFYNHQEFSKGNHNILVVKNKTTNVIKHLRILSRDKILLFDLQPDSETKIPLTDESNDYIWIDVAGEDHEGRSFSGTKELLKGNVDNPVTIYIGIEPDFGVTIVNQP